MQAHQDKPDSNNEVPDEESCDDLDEALKAFEEKKHVRALKISFNFLKNNNADDIPIDKIQSLGKYLLQYTRVSGNIVDQVPVTAGFRLREIIQSLNHSNQMNALLQAMVSHTFINIILRDRNQSKSEFLISLIIEFQKIFVKAKGEIQIYAQTAMALKKDEKLLKFLLNFSSIQHPNLFQQETRQNYVRSLHQLLVRERIAPPLTMIGMRGQLSEVHEGNRFITDAELDVLEPTNPTFRLKK